MIDHARQIRRAFPTLPSWQYGQIAAVHTSTVDVYLDGDTTTAVPGISYLSSYTPKVNDAVLIARMNNALKSDRVVIGALAPTGRPISGRCYATAQTIPTSGTVTQVTLGASDFLHGGVTYGSNGLTVPVAGDYQVSWSVGWQNLGGNVPAAPYVGLLYRNGSQIRQITQVTGSAAQPVLGMSDTVPCAASDTFTLYAVQYSGANQATNPVSTVTYLSVALL